MVAMTLHPKKPIRSQVARGLGAPASLYTSHNVAAAAAGANLVKVNVVMPSGSPEMELLLRTIVTSTAGKRVVDDVKADVIGKAVREALKVAAVHTFERAFAVEIKGVVDAYRRMLRESLVKGEDPGLQAALNRARLQEKILAGTSVVDQTQACELLGLSATNPSATMKRKEDRREILRFTAEGRAVYPLFQFDVEGRRLFPVMAQLIARKPQEWSDFRLLHWLTRPHLDMDGTPAEALGSEPEAVLAAFGLEIEPAVHG